MGTALISVSNKIGLIDLANGLNQLGWQIIASGGTAQAIAQNDIPVQEISNLTGSPEVLGGRVKTLHPAVHGGILARNNSSDLADLSKVGGILIDLVIVNLYPFRQTIAKQGTTFQEAIEKIDIGGVALIRAAAKNQERVSVVTSPHDYDTVLNELRKHGSISDSTRRQLAVKAFQHTASYDRAIYDYLSTQDETRRQSDLSIPAELSSIPFSELRYGENPHQPARLYHTSGQPDPLGGQLRQGKALSYNNLLDLDAAWRAAVSYDRPTVSIVKHLSPCGIASADTLVKAFPAALASDPVSAFGGVIATNQPFDHEIAEALGDLFVECIIAPGFASQALELLAKRKNCRLIDMPENRVAPEYEIRSINHGTLWQLRDVGDPHPDSQWKVVTTRKPTQKELSAMNFAWKACQHVQSNAIVLAQGESTVGIGGGQPNRVDCVHIAVDRAKEKTAGAVMASDAFFPFPDSIEAAADAGVTAVIQPGGSVRDNDSIKLANQLGLAMIFTGERHFRH
jgi:phosphoribosylaminoimidazolecarboxamide formyltransferase / IMP cyclohydrolase